MGRGRNLGERCHADDVIALWKHSKRDKNDEQKLLRESSLSLIV